MERGPVSRRSRRWTLSSALGIAALLLAGAAGAQAETQPSLLLLPIRSHWLAEPLAQAVTAALSNRLSEAGYRVQEIHPDSPAVQLAASEDWLPPEQVEAGNFEPAREALSLALGTEASLSGEVREDGSEIGLSLSVVGAVSEREQTLDVRVPTTDDREAAARALAQATVERLTPELWRQLLLDEAGRREAAVARYAAGQSALADGMYREAVLDFDAALLAEPRNPDYLLGAADARTALGDYSGAAVRMRSLAAVIPSDAEVSVRLGYAALEAGEPAQAESAFLSAAEQLGDDPRVVEGLALASRAEGELTHAQEYYGVLVTLLPGFAGSPSWLPGLLANADEAVRWTDLPPDEFNRVLGEMYLAGGMPAEGIAALLAYYAQEGRPPYDDAAYLRVAAGLDREAEATARAAQEVFAARGLGQIDDDEAGESMERLHDRSDALATLGERIQVSALLDPAHRYRVLAYNFLNESVFESLLFVRTNDSEHQRRAEVLRSAFRESDAEARMLEAALLGPEPPV
jgi:Flp pilus assembly protein TadD